MLEGAQIECRVANAPKWPFLASYGPRNGKAGGMLTLNLGRLGWKWFEDPQAIVDLLIHEFGHHYCSDHLDRTYLNALSTIGARAVLLALSDPAFYVGHGIQLEGVAA